MAACGSNRTPLVLSHSSLRTLLFLVAVIVSFAIVPGLYAAPCTPGSASPSVTICAPASGATVTSPVEVSAAANSSPTATLIQIYLDGVKVFEVKASSLDTFVTMSNGTHRLTVQAYNGTWFKATEYITVSGTSAGVSVSISPTSANVPTGGTQQFSATVGGSSNTSVTWSVDGVVGGNGTVGTISTSGFYTAPGSGGTHTVTATSNADSTKSASATVTVTAGGGPCTPTGPQPSVTICTPASGATVTDPLEVSAAANSTPTASLIQIYVDGVKVYETHASSLDTVLNMSNATHRLTVQAFNGSWFKTAEFITVSNTFTPGTVSVLTYHNDLQRTGVNAQETVLTPANVNETQFGRLASYAVDGQVYAQPLVVPNIQIAGAAHNVVYVATEHDSVYAFDADGKATGAFWQRSLINPAAGINPASSTDYTGIAPEIGITGTPVIDPASGTMYLVTMTNESGNNMFHLYALDILTGADKMTPVPLNPSVQGTGFGNVNGVISIEPGCYQRPGLLLLNGLVYVSWGHCEHGWIASYDAGTLAQVAVFNTTPNGKGGAIWMSGGAPAVDAQGNIYVMSGVDTDSTSNSGYNNAFLKLSPSLTVLDFFIPSNNMFLTQNDADLGSGAPVILPDNTSSHPQELVGGGKDGRIFLLDRNNLGGFNTTADMVVQTVQTGAQQFDNIFDTPVYWNGLLYLHCENDVMRVFQYSNGLLSNSPVQSGPIVYGIHGATASLSANGTSNALIWELQVDQAPNGGHAVLHAFDALNVSQELFNSSVNVTRDVAGPAVKFTVPTVVNGHVYVGTGNQLDVYGLL